MVSSWSHVGNSFAWLIWAICSAQLLGSDQCSWSTKTRCPKVSLGSLQNLRWSNRHKYNVSIRKKKEIFVENISKPMKLNEYLPLLRFSIWNVVVLHQKKRFLYFSQFCIIPSHTIRASSDGREHKREENFPLQKAVLLLFYSCFLLLSLKHLEMLLSGAGYCIKITICLIRYSSSAVPSILLQTVTSSSCLGGSYKEFLCKHKLCTRGNSFLKKSSVV